MTDTTQDVLDLPGFLPVPSSLDGHLVRAVRSTIEQLHRDDRIGPNDAARVALALELAEVIAMKRASGRASTIGQDAKVLADILDGFKEDAKGADDELVEAMGKWSEVIQSLGLSPTPRPQLGLVKDDPS